MIRSLPSRLPRICVALGFPTVAELGRAADREHKDGNSLLEFRLDYLADPAPAIDFLRTFVQANPEALVVATCRHREHDGHFGGSVQHQLAILEDAGRAGAIAVDLEVESAELLKPTLSSLRQTVPLIVSYHNFQNTPALAPAFRRLSRIPADAYKLATTARKPSDNLRLIEFAREHQTPPLIALAMSEMGVATRVLGPSLGSLYTYAAPLAKEGTAPGQISAKLMRTLYRCDKLGKRSRVYGVIADPVAHSKSPLIHNRAFHARRVDAVYLPFLVPPTCLADWMKLAAGLPVSGFSVTIPHKQRILRHLDVIEPLAKRIGAVNTVWRKGGKWRGTNTDTEGVLKPLARHLRLSNASVLLVGYGGAARAAALALSDAGAKVTITGRNMRSAESLARVVKADTAALAAAESHHYDALVHATPVGMHPKTEDTLFRNNVPADVVLDMVYNPKETVLLSRAREQGRTVIYGSEMLLEQAACQFEIWTGESAPRSVMRSAFEAGW